MSDLFDEPKYPDVPGTKSADDTTIEAAASMESVADTLRKRSLELLRTAPQTADEVAAALGESVLSVRPRLSELRKDNYIDDTGVRRRNRSGRRAIVWGPKREA